MEDCKELMPQYLSFIKGVVDAPDLNLNVSREILQQDALVRNIRKNLVKKILELLEGLEKEKYEQFYKEFGPILKIGISDGLRKPRQDREAAPVSDHEIRRQPDFPQAIMSDRMKPDQEEIYYITGENTTTLKNSPHLERLKEKDIEVLLMTDPIDEWVVRDLAPNSIKRIFKSAEKGDLEHRENRRQEERRVQDFFEFIKDELEGQGQGCKALDAPEEFHGLPVRRCVRHERLHGKDPQGHRPEARARKEGPGNQHGPPCLANIKFIYEKNSKDPLLKDYARLLFDLAVVSEGGKVEDPSFFSKTIGNIMAEAITVEELMEGDAIEV